jgi:hypothetical protein
MRSEGGFTMVATLVATTAMAAFALVTVTAVRGDFPLASHDLQSKRAYEAAKAGAEDYAFHLYAEPTYWTKCTGSATNAVNQVNSTTKRRKVPGDAQAEYAIELIPAKNKSSCSTTSPTESMIETSGPGTGSFRIRSKGFDGGAEVSLVTTFKRPSFLDYVYFTQLETSDPVSYGFPNPSEQLTGAYTQCELTYAQGRYNKDIPGTSQECNVISFVSGDEVNGPMHTNDTIAVCGSPVFGRELSDQIEIGGKSPGYFRSCESASPKFEGTRVTSASILVPPASNSKLKFLASEKGHLYSGQVYICLEGTGYKVSTSSPDCSTNSTTKTAPTNGVIYVTNAPGCSSVYSPFTATYPTTSPCGNAYVRGTYSGQLTIAAENDIVIRDDICRVSCGTPSGTGMLGLIANNFVRVYHPYPTEVENPNKKWDFVCGTGTGEERLSDINIDAAVLAINHSFIVDHYDCGAKMGNLNVEGAIAQKFRGPVGTSGNTGYIKNYVYDDRLRYLEPPSFIEPTGTSWVISRQTED